MACCVGTLPGDVEEHDALELQLLDLGSEIRTVALESPPHTHTQKHTNTRVHIHIRRHTQTHKHTRAYQYTHIHTNSNQSVNILYFIYIFYLSILDLVHRQREGDRGSEDLCVCVWAVCVSVCITHHHFDVLRQVPRASLEEI